MRMGRPPETRIRPPCGVLIVGVLVVISGLCALGTWMV